MVDNVVNRVGAGKSHAALVPFPVFDDIRHKVMTWVDELEDGRTTKILAPITEAQYGLLRVRGSARHQRLAEFLQHCIVALENGQTESARQILLTAMAIFGWPAHHP